MKKIFLLILFAATMQPIFAQSINFGVKAGLNESTSQSQYGTTLSDIAGFNAGIFAAIQLNKFSIEPGLSYTTKGYRSHSVLIENLPTNSNAGSNIFNAEGNIVLNYLELPVNVLYHIPVGPLKLFFGGGPYMALALSGTEQGNTTFDGTTTIGQTNKLNFGTDGFKKTDFGLNALAGFSIKNGLLFSVDYGHGFTNILKNSGLNDENRVFSFSVGYAFL